MRFSRLCFRVALIFAACASFLAVSESARSKASLRGAVLVSEGTVYSVPFGTQHSEETSRSHSGSDCLAAAGCQQCGQNNRENGNLSQGWSIFLAGGTPNWVSSRMKWG
jgi:hypothetical protein